MNTTAKSDVTAKRDIITVSIYFDLDFLFLPADILQFEHALAWFDVAGEFLEDFARVDNTWFLFNVHLLTITQRRVQNCHMKKCTIESDYVV